MKNPPGAGVTAAYTYRRIYYVFEFSAQLYRDLSLCRFYVRAFCRDEPHLTRRWQSLFRGSIPLSKFLTRFLRNESGATAIEYGLIAALVAVVLVGALGLMGNKLSQTFTTVTNDLP